MRQMYDAVTASNIPTDAEMVAGYVDPDGTYTWSQADWDRFPHSVKVRIAGHAWTNDGHVLDVEAGDATPDQAPGWATMRRQTGMSQVTVYCSWAVWDDCKAQFVAAGVDQPEWWIAAYPGIGDLLYPGAVAHQWIDDGPYDRSVVADYWPGVDSPTPTSPEDDVFLFKTTDNGKDSYYREAQGYLISIDNAQAYALAFGGAKVVTLGGVIAALAWNSQTAEGLKKIIATGAPV